LLALYKERPEWVQPEFRLNEVRSFVEAGLKDVSISRKTIKWGIPWPDDPEHVFYVWYDALTSYMSGIGYGEGDVASVRKGPAEQAEEKGLPFRGSELQLRHNSSGIVGALAPEEPILLFAVALARDLLLPSLSPRPAFPHRKLC
jgi:hypothetical protein